MLRGKVMKTYVTVALIREMSLYEMSQYFPKLYQRPGENIKVEVDLSI